MFVNLYNAHISVVACITQLGPSILGMVWGLAQVCLCGLVGHGDWCGVASGFMFCCAFAICYGFEVWLCVPGCVWFCFFLLRGGLWVCCWFCCLVCVFGLVFGVALYVALTKCYLWCCSLACVLLSVWL